jgi:hypothetical protein
MRWSIKVMDPFDVSAMQSIISVHTRFSPPPIQLFGPPALAALVETINKRNKE